MRFDLLRTEPTEDDPQDRIHDAGLNEVLTRDRWSQRDATGIPAEPTAAY